MLSMYSDHSTPKLQSQQAASIDKIYHKTITKQKKKTLQSKNKSEHSIILAHPNNRKLRQQTYKICQINSIDQSNSSICNNLITLGELKIDELTLNHKILERKITPDFVECNLSPINFYEDDSELSKKNGCYKSELLQLLNSFPVQVQQLNDRKSYEDSLTYPYERLTLSYQNNKLVKISKKWNYDFLRMMGINQEIINDYIFNHNLLPKCWNFKKIFSVNGTSDFATNIINYQGEEFVSIIQIQTYIEQNKSTSLRDQITYISFRCERKYLNVQKLQENFQKYFNLQQLTSDWKSSINNSRITKRCSFRKSDV